VFVSVSDLMIAYTTTWMLLENDIRDYEKLPDPVGFDANAVYALHEDPVESLRSYFNTHPGGVVFCERLAKCLECALDLFVDNSCTSDALFGTLDIAKHEAMAVVYMLRVGIPICYRIQANYVQRILSETEYGALQEGLEELWDLGSS
jgi:hypothetical protein